MILVAGAGEWPLWLDIAFFVGVLVLLIALLVGIPFLFDAFTSNDTKNWFGDHALAIFIGAVILALIWKNA